jgi:hypothetical protein
LQALRCKVKAKLLEVQPNHVNCAHPERRMKPSTAIATR